MEKTKKNMIIINRGYVIIFCIVAVMCSVFMFAAFCMIFASIDDSSDFVAPSIVFMMFIALIKGAVTVTVSEVFAAYKKTFLVLPYRKAEIIKNHFNYSRSLIITGWIVATIIICIIGIIGFGVTYRLICVFLSIAISCLAELSAASAI